MRSILNATILHPKNIPAFMKIIWRLLIRERTVSVEVMMGLIFFIFGLYMNIFIYYNRHNPDQQVAIDNLRNTFKYIPIEIWGAFLLLHGLALFLAAVFDILRFRKMLSLGSCMFWLYFIALTVERTRSFFGTFTIMFYLIFLIVSIWSYFSTSSEIRIWEQTQMKKVTLFVSARFWSKM